jgi:hypothetical protein
MGVFNIESKANKTIRTNVERNDGWRRAFGEFGYYKEDSEFVLVDKDGTEKMRLELQDFYGQSDLSMGQKMKNGFISIKTERINSTHTLIIHTVSLMV